MVAYEALNKTEDSCDKVNKINLTHVRNDFFESNDAINWYLYVKDIDQAKCDVQFTSKNAYIRFKTSDTKFLKLHEIEDTNTLFEVNVELNDEIEAEKCKYKMTKSKLEIKLQKSSQKRWNTVIKMESVKSSEKVIKIESSSKKVEEQPRVTVPQVPQTKIETQKKEPDVKPKFQEDVRLPYYGKTGLTNLGNTCYMNATLQCLANTTDFRDFFLDGRFQRELNTTNPLGLKGHLAVSYSLVLKKLWLGSYDQLSPAKVRDLLSEKYSQFHSYDQQDAQEFMNALLSLLHEDLNRIEKRPYFEAIEGDGWDDRRLADESWKRFLSRDDSVVVDNFYGQFKSKLTCPECNKVSIIFEAFNSVLVPVPGTKIRIETVVFLLRPEKNVFKYINEVSKTSQLKEIVDQLKDKFDLKQSYFTIFSTIDGKIVQNFPYNATVESLNLVNDQILVINEILKSNTYGEPIIELQIEQMLSCTLLYHDKCNKCLSEGTKQTLKRCTKCYKVAYCNGDCQKNDWAEHKLTCTVKEYDTLSLPFIITFPKSMISQVDLAELVSAHTRNFVEIQVQNANSETSDQQTEAELVYSKLEVQLKNSNKTFSNFNELLEYLNDTNNNKPNNPYSLVLLWTSKLQPFIKQLKLKTTENLSKTFSNTILSRTDSKCSLDDCLKLFTQPEKLTSENPWYCPKCKKHQEATKQIYLWKLPKYLIVILKRFQAHKEDTSHYPDWMQSRYSYILQNRLKYEKLNTLIQFPVKNLNMSPYVYDPSASATTANETATTSNMYDLYGVINHLGNGLQFGHYTAFARCHDQNDTEKNLLGWRSFDDTYVTQLNENNVITRDAYVLFYRRRDTHTATPVSTTTTTTSAASNLIKETKLNLPTELDGANSNAYDIDENELSSESSLDEYCSFDDENDVEDEQPPPYTNLNELD